MLKYSLLISSIFIISCKHNTVEPVTSPQPCNASYAVDIKPMINNKCVISGCHGNNGLANLADYKILKERAENGNLKKYVMTLGLMPPSGAANITEDEKIKLQCWLENKALEN